MSIYKPSDDSYLLQETLKEFLKNNNTNKNKNISILDMGSGTGIQSQTCKELGFSNIIVSDINPEAISHLKKADFSAIKSDLFSNLKDKFDLIIFNPPYLPLDKREPKDSRVETTAGKEGYEIIIKFLEQAFHHLNKESSILLLFSSLSQPRHLLKTASNLGYYYKLLNKKKIPFEELYVYKFILNE